MNKVKHAIALASLVTISAIGLYGCGGDSATPTAVAPTATTAAIVEPTATTATMEEPTATTATMEEPTATTGSVSNSGGDNNSDALGRLKSSGEAMKSVKSYHIVIKGETSGVSTTTEGDVLLPDKMRLNVDTGAGKTEMIIVGSNAYMLLPGTDAYTEIPGLSSPMGAATTTGFEDYAQDAKIVGDETIDGVDTTHITFSYDANKAAAAAAQSSGQVVPTPSTDMTLVNAEVWVEKSTNFMHQFVTTTDIAGTKSTSTITFSKFNEDVTPPIEKPTNIQTMPTMPEIPTIVVP
ncbi:MAG: LppX_LprAFG lipoprotein [Chloroflexota bacterium]